MTRPLLVLTLLTLSACSTVNGIGQDISGGASMVQGWFGG